jgi:hypothetical protein
MPTGAANMTRTDSAIDFDWGNGSPLSGDDSADGFVVRWTTTVELPAGRYRFTTSTDDGVKLVVDGFEIIDDWEDQGTVTNTAERVLTAGNHTFVVKYYENSGEAVARFSYENLIPVMQTYTPADGATDMALDADLVLAFSRNITTGVGGDIVIYGADDEALETISSADSSKVSISGSTVTIDPASNLAELADYYVQIGAGAFSSTDGYAYAGISDKTTWNFTTEDSVKPGTSDDYGAEDGAWQDADQTITLTPVDPSPSSGLAWTKYCTDDGSTPCNPSTGTTLASPYQVTISSEGTTYLRYASQDNDGNTQTTVSREVKIDKTVPSVEAGSDEATGVVSSRTATASDSLSGIDTSTYRWAKVSGPGQVTFSNVSSLNTSISTDREGTYVISFSATDNAGNTGSDSFTLTKTGGCALPPAAYAAPKAPAGGFGMSINGGAAAASSRSVSLELNAGSDVNRIAISMTGDFEDASIEEFRKAMSWDLCAEDAVCPDGEYIVYARFYTAWGKSSQAVSDSIILISDSGNDQEAAVATFSGAASESEGESRPAGDQSGEGQAAADPASKFVFTRYLYQGMSGEDVRQLQIFLNRSGFIVAVSGYGSIGQETAYFGPATRQALVGFQKKYGLRPYPGRVGPLTLKLLNSLP